MLNLVQRVLLLSFVFCFFRLQGEAASFAFIWPRPQCPELADTDDPITMLTDVSLQISNDGDSPLTGTIQGSTCDSYKQCNGTSRPWSVEPHTTKVELWQYPVTAVYTKKDIGKTITLTAMAKLSGDLAGTGSGSCSYVVHKIP